MKKKKLLGKVDKTIKIEFIEDPGVRVSKTELKKVEKEIKEIKKILDDLNRYRNYLQVRAKNGLVSNSSAWMWEQKMKGNIKTIKIDYSKINTEIPCRCGLKISKECKCGEYEPKSSKGLIDTDCANCGGKKPIIKLR